MLFQKASAKHLLVQRGQCFVPLSRAKLRALQTCQRKFSLLNQKQRLCRSWAQQQIRAALTRCLPPGCLTNQVMYSYTTTLSHFHRIVLLLLPTKSQTLPKAVTQQSPRQREEAKLSLLNKQVFWSYHTPVLVARRRHVKVLNLQLALCLPQLCLKAALVPLSLTQCGAEPQCILHSNQSGHANTHISRQQT